MAAGSAATVSGSPPPPPPAPLAAYVEWVGFTPENVSGASGSSTGAFNGRRTGGVDPVTFSWSVIGNPSGKLSLINADPGIQYVHYSGFSINQQESIAVMLTVTDSTGAVSTASNATTIKRTS